VGFGGALLGPHTVETDRTIGASAEAVIFASSIMCRAFPDTAAPPASPSLRDQISPDYRMTGLTLHVPLRTRADHVENDVRPFLPSTRAD
jgi:hypothetical protein